MTRRIEGRRIALVGGAGLIGHTLALELKSMGAEVHVVDDLVVNNLMTFVASEPTDRNAHLYHNFVTERLQLLRKAGVPVIVEDARDYHRLSRILNEIRPQVVVHLAAVAHANKSNKDPHSTFDHSFRTLENALDSTRQFVEHFIYMSSSMVYGNFESGTVTEDSVCNPLGIYAALKYSGEKLVIAYNQVFDLPYTIVRPSALYGERDVGRRVVQLFIENAMRGEGIKVMGDGSDRMDFTYIGDFIQGVVKIIGNENSINQTFNITCGNGRSLNELAGMVKHHFPAVTVQNMERDRLMPERGTLSIEKARQMVGYEPAYPLEKGFAKYVEWYKSLSDFA